MNQETVYKAFLALKKSSPKNLVQTVLILKKLTQREICKRYNITPSGLSMVINGQRKTPWIRKAIAREIGIPAHELFETIDWRTNGIV